MLVLVVVEYVVGKDAGIAEEVEVPKDKIFCY